MGAVDHVIVATRDLDAASRRLSRELGLESVSGGVHPDYGTANHVVPVGGGAYLELMAIDDPDVADNGVLGPWLAAQTRDGDRLAAWMVAPGDFDATVSRLDLDVVPGTRRLPDGSVLSWRLAGLVTALTEPPLPAFISWDVGGPPHPSTAAARHRCQPLGVAWLEAAGDRGRLLEWLGPETDGIDLRVVDGEPGLRAVGIGCADGAELVVR